MLLHEAQQLQTPPPACTQVGRIQHVSSADEMRSAAQDCNEPGYMVMDCSDWQIIPAENLVAAFQAGNINKSDVHPTYQLPRTLQQPLHCLQDKPASLLGLATSAEDARVMLEALEAGTSGVVLKTQDPLQVHSHVP